MNIVSALARLAEQHKLVTLGFEHDRPHAFLVVAENGKASLEINNAEDDRFPISPMAFTSNRKYGVGIDKIGTILGTRSSKTAETATAQHAAFWDTISLIAEESKMEEAAAFLAFRKQMAKQAPNLLESSAAMIKELKKEHKISDKIKDDALEVALKLDGSRRPFFCYKHMAFRRVWQKMFPKLYRQVGLADKKSNTVFVGRCSVSGVIEIIPRCHRKVLQISNFTPSLTSRNSGSTETTGFVKSEASRVGLTTVEAYVEGFRAVYANRLHEGGKPVRTRHNLWRNKKGDSQAFALIWSESMGNEVEKIGEVLTAGWSLEKDDEEEIASVEEVSEAVHKVGHRTLQRLYVPLTKFQGQMYLAIMTTEMGRMTLNVFEDCDGSRLLENVGRWFSKLTISEFSLFVKASPDDKARWMPHERPINLVPLRWLAQAIDVDRKLTDVLYMSQCAFLGLPIPVRFHDLAVDHYLRGRLKEDRLYSNGGYQETIEKRVCYRGGIHALAMIKAYHEEHQVNTENDAPFQLGRAYALYGLICHRWARYRRHKRDDFETTFQRAMLDTPSLTLAMLDTKVQPFLSTIGHHAALRWAKGEIVGIVSRIAEIGGVPRRLANEQRGRFVLGRYAQEREIMAKEPEWKEQAAARKQKMNAKT